MDDLKFFDLPEGKSITKKTKEKTKKVQSIMIQKSVLRNALKLHDKRIYLYSDSEPSFEENIPERVKQTNKKSDEENPKGKGIKY